MKNLVSILLLIILCSINIPVKAQLISNTTFTTPSSGWFRLGSWDASERGSVRVVVSLRGGAHTPQSVVIDAFKTWSTGLHMELKGINNHYIEQVRIVEDGGPYYIEAYFDRAIVNSAHIHLYNLEGSATGFTISSGVLVAGGGDVRLESDDIIFTTQLENKLHVKNDISANGKLAVTGTAKVGGTSGTTALTNSDELVVESSSDGGLSVLVPNSNLANFYMGNPSDNAAAGIRWDNSSKIYTIGTLGSGSLRLLTGNFTNDQGIVIDNLGKVGIGTSTPQSKLAVEGQIRATEVKVLADISVPDYVFEPDYELRTLKETKEYITENKHLPEIPSATEIGENGIDLGDMNMRLLKKIEELTLYQIELLERLEKAEQEISQLKSK